MQVQDSVDLGEGHSIEFGQATCNPMARSVRNRYQTPTGGFSPRSSSEIPIEDIMPLVVETLRRDLVSPEETMRILQATVDFLRRRLTQPGAVGA
jgi:hypothetical protein